MKIFPMIEQSGQLHAFEISNSFVSRSSVVRIVRKIPRVTISSKPKLLSWFRESKFCSFTVDGQKFSVEEPFGDNSRYLVSAEPPGPCMQFEAVEKAFAEA